MILYSGYLCPWCRKSGGVRILDLMKVVVYYNNLFNYQLNICIRNVKVINIMIFYDLKLKSKYFELK